MTGSIKIDRFDGKNSFSLWQIKMRSLLKQQDLWLPLANKAGTDTTTAAFVKMEEKAHATIMLCLADDVISGVADQETAAGLWAKLEELYAKKSVANKLMLKQRLFGLRMVEGTRISDHIDNLNTILLELRNSDEIVSDVDAALILLVSLPPSFEGFVQSFVIGKETITLEEVRSALHTRELRHKAVGKVDHANGALFVKGGRGKGYRRGGSSLPPDVCAFCREKGHWKRECPKNRSSVAIASGGGGGTLDDDEAL